IVVQRPLPDRVAFVAQLAAAWARLRATPAAERRIAIVLANYPNRDGRIGNGVGLDTPAGVIEVVRALRGAGYEVGDAPADSAVPMQRLLSGPTNKLQHGPASFDKLRMRESLRGTHDAPHPELVEGRTALIPVTIDLLLGDYQVFFNSLPQRLQAQITDRWG